jgi:hypothetical protein
MIKSQYDNDCCGGQPVQGDEHAAATLAQGSNRSKRVPAAYGMKDQDSAGEKLTGRGAGDPYGK